jgi:uncharacterized protein
MLKYLLVVVVVGVMVWLLTAKARPPAGPRPGSPRGGKPAPQAMLSCSRCGLHLPAGDAVLDGSRVYCSDAHRALGPATER